jgi:hypothetical protein
MLGNQRKNVNAVGECPAQDQPTPFYRPAWPIQPDDFVGLFIA